MKPNTRRLLTENATISAITSSSSSSASPSLSGNNHDNSNSITTPYSTSSFDSSMAIILLALLSVLFFMGIFSVCVRRLSHGGVAAAELSRPSRQRSLGTRMCPRGADPAVVHKLPLFAYDSSAKRPRDCAICLSEFEEKETVKIIPRCRHIYHPLCIDSWLSSHDSCPLCRSTQLLSLQADVRLQVFDEISERIREEEEVGRETGTRECCEGGGGGDAGQMAVMRRTGSCSSSGASSMLPRSCSF